MAPDRRGREAGVEHRGAEDAEAPHSRWREDVRLPPEKNNYFASLKGVSSEP